MVNREMRDLSLHFLDNNPKVLQNKSGKFTDNITLVIGIVSIRRMYDKQELGYLTQVVAQTVRSLEHSSFSYKLFICNVHSGPGKHSEAERLSEYVQLLNRFPEGSSHHSIMDPFEREKNDYSFCLNASLQFPAKYVLLLQDDAVPKNNMFTILSKLMSMSKFIFYDHLHVHRTFPWDAIQLYFPERWQGYTFSLKHILELLSIGCLATPLLIKMITSLLGRTFRIKSYNLYLSCFIYILLFCYTIGRQNILPFIYNSLNIYYLNHRNDCCLPGVIFRKSTALSAMTYLNNTTCNSFFPVDMALEKLFNSLSFHVYSIYPNAIEHIGFISTIKSPNFDELI